MVYLKKIETRGFKSMGTKTISTPVERGFVAITGPNGSGKSNLLDAILFALGENSAKTLRVPNLTALIYDGSVEEQKPSSAKVSLQFDNTDRRIPIDADSVTITRELKQSGESIYSLNGKHVQRNNLSELLEMALIASRGLNVVLQGMITRISELVPDEKRKLIEQMVGIAQFDEKKQLALTQLREADVKLEVAMAKIGEIRDRVQLLEQQRNDQLRFEQLENEINWLRAVSSSSKLSYVRRMRLQRSDAVNERAAKLEQLQNRVAELSKSIEQFDSERSVLIKSAVDTGAAQIEVELGNTTNELNALKKERKEALDFIDKMRQISPVYQQMSEDHRARIAQSEAQIESVKHKIAEAETRRKVLLDAHSALSLERSAFESELSAAQSEIGQTRRAKEAEDGKLQSIRDNHSQLTREHRSAEERLASIQERIKFLNQSLEEATKNVDELQSLLSAQRAELGEAQKARAKLEQLRKRVEQQLDIAALILEKTQTVVTRYDSDLSAIENVASEEVALARLESLGNAKAIHGYLGPLRALISYDSKYTQAIAALGRDWLNAVVVEDVGSLIRTAEAARKLKISRLTAIPIGEVGAFDKADPVPSMEGLIAPVTEIVDSNPKIRRIVNFVFGDAIIVDSPRHAFTAARRGFRAVTLQGDMFEPDIFAYETGYSKKYAQISDILGKKQSYDAIRKTLANLRSVIDKRKQSLGRLHSKYDESFKDEQSRNISISKIEAQLESTKKYLARFAESSDSLTVKEKETREEISRLDNLLGISRKRLEEQTFTCENLAKKISSIDLSLLDTKGAELNKRRLDLDAQTEAVTQEIRDFTTDLTRVRGDLENNQRPALERLVQQQYESEANLAAKQKLLAETEPRLQELEVIFARLKEEEAKSIEKTTRFQPMLDAFDARIKSLKIEEEATRKTAASVERELIAANLDLDRLKDSEESLMGQLSMWGYTEPVEAFEGADDLLRELNTEFDTLRNNVNQLADKNYREIFENYKYSSVRKNDLEKERNAIVTFIETIDAEKRKVFMDAFERIDRELRTIFNKITNGQGWLEIENPDAIFDSGLFLMTQFPGKLPRDSSSVSGGEKTISALSFILAIQAVFPSPFYVFDEVDAHLDSNYSGKLAEILAERSGLASQIIIVSLKDTVVSKAGSVIGVYMSQGSSKIIRYRSGMEVEVRSE